MDKDFGITANLDQMACYMRDFAPVVKAYYDSLLKQGFDMNTSFTLTRDWHRTLWESVYIQRPK